MDLYSITNLLSENVNSKNALTLLDKVKAAKVERERNEACKLVQTRIKIFLK